VTNTCITRAPFVQALCAVRVHLPICQSKRVVRLVPLASRAAVRCCHKTTKMSTLAMASSPTRQRRHGPRTSARAWRGAFFHASPSPHMKNCVCTPSPASCRTPSDRLSLSLTASVRAHREALQHCYVLSLASDRTHLRADAGRRDSNPDALRSRGLARALFSSACAAHTNLMLQQAWSC
jgi:hypothetical protein